MCHIRPPNPSRLQSVWFMPTLTLFLFPRPVVQCFLHYSWGKPGPFWRISCHPLIYEEISLSKLEDHPFCIEKEAILQSHDSDIIMCETDQGGEGKQEQEHFLLIHGLGHGAWCWYKVVTLLKQKGHRVVALDLTSNGINKAAPADEITSVAHYSEPLIQYLQSLGDDEKVTLVGHSLAGCPLSYAMEMYPNKVSKAIFLAAFTPRNNQSFLSSAFPAVFPRLVTNGVVELNYGKGNSEMPTSASFVMDHAKPYLYNESPEEDMNLAVSRLTPTPYPISMEVLNLSDENYGSVRKFYIMLMKDKLFSPEHQQYSVDQNPPEGVFKMHASDHSPFFSQPEQLCNLLNHIATL